MKKYILIILLLTSYYQIVAQKYTRQDYIINYKDIAVSEMKRTGIPASITLAQGILESNNGNSTLALKANNHFGIKCHNDWNGKTYHHDDDKPNECFRKYKSADESFYDHSAFLTKHTRYAFLFNFEITDYKSWAKGLKKAGYATHPKYDKLLIKIIEANQLYQFDNDKFKQPKEERLIADVPNILAQDVDDYAIDPFGTNVKSTNRIDYVISQEGDTYESIAEINDLMPWQLYKYNEKTRGAGLEVGETVYLQPKRRKADVKFKFHVVKEGESMYDISQKYGIRLKSLFKLNNLELGDEPKVGEQLSLRKRIKKS